MFDVSAYLPLAVKVGNIVQAEDEVWQEHFCGNSGIS